MALLTISGYPCAGKTTRARQIKEYFEAKLAEPGYVGPAYSVVIIDEAGVNVTRAAYDGEALAHVSSDSSCAHIVSFLLDSLSEKPARASVFAALQRTMTPENLVICDGLNYIKGYRYQMYCAAREAKVRPLTVRRMLLQFATDGHSSHAVRLQVYVAAPPEKCREWHDARTGDRYKQETCARLVPPPGLQHGLIRSRAQL